jgi:hypothetical protein
LPLKIGDEAFMLDSKKSRATPSVIRIGWK